jgi:hypothetical protein
MGVTSSTVVATAPRTSTASATDTSTGIITPASATSSFLHAHRLPSTRPRTGPGSALVNDGTTRRHGLATTPRPRPRRTSCRPPPALGPASHRPWQRAHQRRHRRHGLATTPRPPRTRRTARRQQLGYHASAAPNAPHGPPSATVSIPARLGLRIHHPPLLFRGKRGVILLNHPSSTLSFLPFPPIPPCQLRLLPKLPVWWRRRGVCCYFPTYPGSSVTFLQANLPCIPILLSSASSPQYSTIIFSRVPRGRCPTPCHPAWQQRNNRLWSQYACTAAASARSSLSLHVLSFFLS